MAGFLRFWVGGKCGTCPQCVSRSAYRFASVRPGARVPTGHVFRVERARGPVWYAKYRLPTGRQVQKKLGPAWTQRGRPPAGYFTKRLAEAWLRSVLDDARRGVVPGQVRTGATFADAAAEYLRYIEHDRAPQAVDAARLPIGATGSSATSVWLDGCRGRDERGNRALDRWFLGIGFEPATSS